RVRGARPRPAGCADVSPARPHRRHDRDRSGGSRREAGDARRYAEHAQLRRAARARRTGRLTVGTADGHVVGVQKVVDNGPNAERYNIVILGDGYRASELDKFAADVDAFVATFQGTAPYDKLWPGINVHRVDVASTDSGADDPGTCGDNSTGSGVRAR